MRIQFSCPLCKKPIACSERFAGRQFACPGCRATLSVPVPAPRPHEEPALLFPEQFVSDEPPVARGPVADGAGTVAVILSGVATCLAFLALFVWQLVYVVVPMAVAGLIAASYSLSPSQRRSGTVFGWLPLIAVALVYALMLANEPTAADRQQERERKRKLDEELDEMRRKNKQELDDLRRGR